MVVEEGGWMLESSRKFRCMGRRGERGETEVCVFLDFLIFIIIFSSLCVFRVWVLGGERVAAWMGEGDVYYYK